MEDYARLAVECGRGAENVTRDAVGPERFTYDELVRVIAGCIDRPAHVLHLPAALVYMGARVLGTVVGDVLLTREEIAGLMANLLVSKEKPTGTTLLSQWARANAVRLGAKYASEIQRHYAAAR